MADEDRDNKVQMFCSMCAAGPEKAVQYLEAHEWDVMAACNSYFQDEEEQSGDETQEATSSAPSATTAPPPLPPADPSYTGPRTLDGRPAPAGSSSSRPSAARSARQPKKKGVATLGSLGSAGNQNDDDDDDDDEGRDDNDRGNLFAGGEKSGLAVQDPKQEQAGPRKIISDILAKAKANSERPETDGDAGPSQARRSRGPGMTLGGDGVESRSIPDPFGPTSPASGPPQERVLHIWDDGFSIDDGDLRRFDDPAHQMDLAMIRSGRAPLHLMNVQHDQPVDVKLQQHEGPYKPPPKAYKPFSGPGQRLGAPVPGEGSSAAAAAASTTTQSAATSSSATLAPTIDSSQPTITIRIQMPDGTRLPARFNTTQTMGDVYGFVQGASREVADRAWVIATTFPNKDHTDKSLILGDMAEFKKGGTAMVKWV